MENYSIGIFDSGVGGLTVMRQVMHHFPRENIIYLGDTARVPYGNKGADTIIRYSFENANFLFEKKVKLIVVACHTASAYAAEKLCNAFDVPVIDVIQPTVVGALEMTRNGRIAILGTKATISSGVYQSKILEADPSITLFPVPCPLFVPLVEEKMTHHHITRLMAEEYLSFLQNEEVDTVILGCTHYPLLHDVIKDALGEHVSIVNSAAWCIKAMEKLFDSSRGDIKNIMPKQCFFVSDDPEKFKEHGEAFLGFPIRDVNVLHPDDSSLLSTVAY